MKKQLLLSTLLLTTLMTSGCGHPKVFTDTLRNKIKNVEVMYSWTGLNTFSYRYIHHYDKVNDAYQGSSTCMRIPSYQTLSTPYKEVQRKLTLSTTVFEPMYETIEAADWKYTDNKLKETTSPSPYSPNIQILFKDQEGLAIMVLSSTSNTNDMSPWNLTEGDKIRSTKDSNLAKHLLQFSEVLQQKACPELKPL
jgi:hypothetical protein